MVLKRRYISAAAFAFAACLAAAPSELRAQATVAIDNDDIGGVVTGRPARAGVWSSPRRQTCHQIHQDSGDDDQGATSFPTCPRPNSRSGCGLWPCRFSQVDAEPARSSIIPP